VKRLVLTILVLWSLDLRAQKTLDEGVAELATQITTSATKQEKQRIAVLPFHELDGPPTVLGTYLAEELVTKLFQLGNFKIVERQLLDRVMGELKIQRSGAIDPATAKEIGRIAAVDAIVTGASPSWERMSRSTVDSLTR
jgi:curli biogenesis system outer membrane secretion channel CsgG